MKKLISVLLAAVLMVAIASSALADIVGYGFSVTTSPDDQSMESSEAERDQTGVSSAVISSDSLVKTAFGVKSNQTGAAAVITLFSDPQVSGSARLYFKMLAMDGTDASRADYFEGIGTRQRMYYASHGIQGQGYKVAFWKQSASDPNHVISGRFTP